MKVSEYVSEGRWELEELIRIQQSMNARHPDWMLVLTVTGDEVRWYYFKREELGVRRKEDVRCS